MTTPRLSVVVTTRNEAANIAACVRSFGAALESGAAEVIVVDNGSTDATREIAATSGAAVCECGPERCAQRNFGWRKARGEWVLILDADMIVPSETVGEILEKTAESEIAAWWIPEVRTGTGFRVKVRNFERGFYNGTCIDALRLFRRDVLERTGGYDENLLPGGEDWELDIRVLALGVKCAVLTHHLIHNEKQLTLARMLEKKAYYTRGMDAYRAKWAGHPAVRRQFSPFYRFVGVFIERGKWRRIVRHPILFCGVMVERFAVALTYLFHRGRRA